MLSELNWAGIGIGSGAGFVVGIAASALAGGGAAPTWLQVVIQIAALAVAGAVAARLSLVASVAAGGFAALLLYFGLAVVSIISGHDLHPVAVALFGLIALAVGSAGGWVVERFRRS